MSNRSRDMIAENDLISLQYQCGVNEFICVARFQLNSVSQAKCPCRGCNNAIIQPIEVVRVHLLSKKFTPYYNQWYHHDEPRHTIVIKDAVVEIERDVGRLHENLTLPVNRNAM